MKKPTLAWALSALLAVLTVPQSAFSMQSLTPKQQLGRQLYSDPDLSLKRNQSCASCHSLQAVKSPQTGLELPTPGFVDEENVLGGTAVSEGSVDNQHGTLNAPSAGYAAFSPFFHWDSNEGLYVGGQFWNGRAATLAEQAKQPFLNPREMAMPNRWSVVSRVKEKRRYVRIFKKLYGLNLDLIPPYFNLPPIPFISQRSEKHWRADRTHHASRPTPPGVVEAYDKIAEAIAAFEKSRVFNRFTSKFDFVLAGWTEFSPLEAKGRQLFEGKALCSACHVSEPTTAPDGSVMPPLFTDFTYDNIGVPRNVNIPGNPEADPGLGGRADIALRDPDGNEIGKHKVMSLRNIAVTPPYAHNGVFPDLASIVHFYNTRDVLGRITDNNDPEFGISGWPEPEITANVNHDELGNLHLSEDEEAAVVAFLKTLTDGYPESGGDPLVPPGTPSPFGDTPFPPIP